MCESHQCTLLGCRALYANPLQVILNVQVGVILSLSNGDVRNGSVRALNMAYQPRAHASLREPQCRLVPTHDNPFCHFTFRGPRIL